MTAMSPDTNIEGEGCRSCDRLEASLEFEHRRYIDARGRIAELEELCSLVAAFSAPRLREHRLWILADAVDQAKALLSSASTNPLEK